MFDFSGTRVVVEKASLQGDFRHLQRALTDYRQALTDEAGPDGDRDVVRLLRRQHLALTRARVSLGAGELGIALLRHVLRRLPSAELRFRPRNGHAHLGAGPVAALAAPSSEAPSELQTLMGGLATLVQHAPLELQEKLRRTLAGLLDCFTALAEGQTEPALAAVARINLATSNAQSREMLREIALITSDVYKTLREASAELPLDALSESSGGLSEAVRRLNSVVQRLEDAATQNLDCLERVNDIAREQGQHMGGVIGTLRDAQKRLMQVKAAHPELEEALERIQQRLADHVGGPAMTLQHDLARGSAEHLELISNQSFQELTSRTLRRIIEFVQSLEAQLYELLQTFHAGGTASLTPEPPATAADDDTATAGATHTGTAQSQGDVDQLLQELGF